MSLFSLNRIYKPNRHTPTPLTQTHNIVVPLNWGTPPPLLSFKQGVFFMYFFGDGEMSTAKVAPLLADKGNILFLLCLLSYCSC